MAEDIQSIFGAAIQHPLKDGYIAVAFLTRGGWVLPQQHPCLSHQTYRDKLDKLKREFGAGIEEVAFIDLHTGNWHSVEGVRGEQRYGNRNAKTRHLDARDFLVGYLKQKRSYLADERDRTMLAMHGAIIERRNIDSYLHELIRIHAKREILQEIVDANVAAASQMRQDGQEAPEEASE